jgi:predicted nucleic acid-binding protein
MVFADSAYWVALLNPGDQLHRSARALDQSLSKARIVTTEFVLAELLNFYAPRGRMVRAAAGELARHVLADTQIEVAACDRELFAAGLAFYARRPDKQYSLTDCLSMLIMRNRRITEALTEDQHFRQEGFVTLLEVG